MQGMEGTLLSPAPPSQGAYLPAFLMGEMPSTINMSSNKPYMLSPTKMPYNSPWRYSHSQAASESFAAHQTPRSEQKNRMREKPGAPPVQGLIESMASPATKSVWQTPDDSHRTIPGTPSYQAQMSSPMKMSPIHQSPPAPAPFYGTPRQSSAFGSMDQQTGQGEEDCCVTVFGFQPSAASFILQQFSQFGTILDHQIASAGNWMHLRYQSSRQAGVALSRNGRLFGNVMVGVGPCNDRSFVDKQQQQQLGQLSMATPQRNDSPWLSRVQQADRSAAGNSSMLAGGTSMYASPGARSGVYDGPRSGAGVKRSASMRPLTSNYRQNQINSPILNADGAPPTKRTGFVGKAMGYIFGL